MSEPKTKVMAEFLSKLELEGKRVLFMAPDQGKESDERGNFQKSIRNIPKMLYRLAQNVNGYDVVVSHDVVVMANALDELKSILRREV